jgi:hypothetical protein
MLHVYIQHFVFSNPSFFEEYPIPLCFTPVYVIPNLWD